MRVAVMGGKLQGVEACYLARKAGWSPVLADRLEARPAQALCDEFHCLDFLDAASLERLLESVDMVIPALEDQDALDQIEQSARRLKVPVLYDAVAYRLSSSKLRSDAFFSDLGVPAPKPWPHCEFPLTVKPSGASGSAGVRRVENEKELQALCGELGSLAGWVIQEYLEGPSYSLEVVAFQGRCRTFQVTELEMDAVYDCKRVLAPARLSAQLDAEFHQLAHTLAQALQLEGIMDVEVILHQGQLKVLEIDARLPSQTLTTVYHSTGMNALEASWKALAGEALPSESAGAARGVVYEHIQVKPGCLEVCGEHIMADAGPLVLQQNFFGVDEALTNYQPGADCWEATLITTGTNREEAWEKRCAAIAAIQESQGLLYKEEQP
ncbi:3-methylornithine--L-lysine ligase PylC [uncultured Anaeromusa sp.]|uniref:3-methylornithine--L-lysine ligase PylC n=1 Tax=uncultured Anaeromusa sp. TaxID=673273 RepID=UPI0029C831D1|nr:3-methylornithine--L-lysine ligase PylC [uncultured Anaeromusa sp.]